MAKFIVEDRSSGRILLEASMSADGLEEIHHKASDISEEDVARILQTVRDDLRDGSSGGTLHMRGVEWFET